VYSKKAGYALAVNRALSQLGGQWYSFDGDLPQELAAKMHGEEGLDGSSTNL
jgi:hypothetical protein